MVLCMLGDGKGRHGSLQGNLSCKTKLPPKKESKYAKQLDILGNYIISVKTVEKRVDCFYGLVVLLHFLLSVSVTSPYPGTTYTVQRSVTLLT